jgi:hypothetical protein
MAAKAGASKDIWRGNVSCSGGYFDDSISYAAISPGWTLALNKAATSHQVPAFLYSTYVRTCALRVIYASGLGLTVVLTYSVRFS